MSYSDCWAYDLKPGGEVDSPPRRSTQSSARLTQPAQLRAMESKQGSSGAHAHRDFLQYIF